MLGDVQFYVSAFTPFDGNGNIALNLIEPYVEYLGKLNVEGMSILGINGEGNSMTIDEMKTTAEEFIKAAHKYGIKDVNLNVTALCLKDVKDLTKHAEKLGVTSVTVLPLPYHKPSTPMEIFNYLNEIAGNLTTTKVLYANAPEVTSVYVRLTDLIDFASNIENFAGFYDSGVDLADLSQAIWKAKKLPKICIYCCRNVDIIPYLAVGCRKFVGAAINFCLPIYRQIVSKYHTEEGLELQNKFLLALNTCYKYGLGFQTGFLKACTEKISNIELGIVRAPGNLPSQQIIDVLDKELLEMNFWNLFDIPEENNCVKA